ncbi:MAG TPA: HAD-IB family hydrolase [bacterium]
MKAVSRHPSRIAVFDVDRTLIIGTSVEIQLIRFLLNKQLLPSANLIRAVAWIPCLMRKGLKEATLRNKFYLYGMEAEFVQSLMPEFFQYRLRPLFSHQMLMRMSVLKKTGHAIILISGTLDFILDQLIHQFGADGGMGTTVEIVDGRFTGRVIGIYPFYREKVDALMSVLDGKKVDFERSTGFADSWADIPLLSLLGRPVAMNPDWGLRREALKRGWSIVTESLRH